MQTLNCPTCGAPLEVYNDTPFIKCTYCNHTVIVPAEMREPPKEKEPKSEIIIDLSNVSLNQQQIHPKPPSSLRLWFILLIGVIIICLISTFFLPTVLLPAAVFSVSNQLAEKPESDEPTITISPSSTPQPTLTPTPGFASLSLLAEKEQVPAFLQTPGMLPWTVMAGSMLQITLAVVSNGSTQKGSS